MQRYQAYLGALTDEVRRARERLRGGDAGRGRGEWRAELGRQKRSLVLAAEQRAAISEHEVEAVERLGEVLEHSRLQAEEAARTLEQLAKAPVDALPPARQREVRDLRVRHQARAEALRSGSDVRAQFGDAAVDAYRAQAQEIDRLRRALLDAAAE